MYQTNFSGKSKKSLYLQDFLKPTIQIYWIMNVQCKYLLSRSALLYIISCIQMVITRELSRSAAYA